MEDLDNILNENEPEAVEAPVEPVAEAEAAVRNEKGQFAPKGEKEEDAPPASEEKAKTGQEAAIVAERRKRQEVEERYTALEKQIAALQQAAPARQEEPAPSLWEDEQGWQSHFGGQVVQTAVQQATQNARLDMSEMMARQNHADFDDMKESFLKMAEMNPAIAQQALSDSHPWDKAYRIAKNAKTMEELGATDIDTLKAQLLEQLKAEQTQVEPVKIPQSLAGEQSARGNVANPGGSLSLEDILKG